MQCEHRITMCQFSLSIHTLWHLSRRKSWNRCACKRWKFRNYIKNLLSIVRVNGRRCLRILCFTLILLIMRLLIMRKFIIVTVKLGHARHIKWTKSRHHKLTILFFVPHLRVLLRQLAFTHSGTIAVICETTFLAISLSYMLSSCSYCIFFMDNKVSFLAKECHCILNRAAPTSIYI